MGKSYMLKPVPAAKNGVIKMFGNAGAFRSAAYGVAASVVEHEQDRPGSSLKYR